MGSYTCLLKDKPHYLVEHTPMLMRLRLLTYWFSVGMGNCWKYNICCFQFPQLDCELMIQCQQGVRVSKRQESTGAVDGGMKFIWRCSGGSSPLFSGKTVGWVGGCLEVSIGTWKQKFQNILIFFSVHLHLPATRWSGKLGANGMQHILRAVVIVKTMADISKNCPKNYRPQEALHFISYHFPRKQRDIFETLLPGSHPTAMPEDRVEFPGKQLSLLSALACLS